MRREGGPEAVSEARAGLQTKIKRGFGYCLKHSRVLALMNAHALSTPCVNKSAVSRDCVTMQSVW